MTNKRVPGTVSQFWQERQVDGPELNLWSAPNEAHEDFILVCWARVTSRPWGDD